MLYIEESAIKNTFTTMMNKLVFGHQRMLKPMLSSLKGTDDRDRLIQIQRIEQEIEDSALRKQTLVSLASQGILEPAVYTEECTALSVQEERLMSEKKRLISEIGGDRTKLQELEKLMQFTGKGQMMDQFEDDIFNRFAEKIVVADRDTAIFYLKCGLKLKERLVK